MLHSLTYTSRPNRAYARQHSYDYVRYSRGSGRGEGGGFMIMNWGRGRHHHHPHQSSSSSSNSFYKAASVESKACFDKVILLNTILDKQNKDESEEQNHHVVASLFALPAEVQYKAVALLPPDAIITDLDSNLFDLLLPQDKLVAIAGFQKPTSPQEELDPPNTYTAAGGDGRTTTANTISSSKTDILLFNLQHRHANAVAKMWWDLVEPAEVTCGNGNDITLLIDAISFVLEDGEELSSVIAALEETNDGFVRLGHQMNYSDQDEGGSSKTTGEELLQQQPMIIKGIPPSIPQSRAHMLLSNLDSVRVQLQTTADSVCYRYYPACFLVS